jgi:hypothetical protein
MDNMSIYEKVRQCPQSALRPINAGRLKGKSDINPMWRIKALTETFGARGIGWYYDITRQWTEQGANGEISAFVNINLYVLAGGEWSKPIVGTGGSAFVANERNGQYTNDEAYKMALTDAISVACKALGFAADVYWQQDATKYTGRDTAYNGSSKPADAPERICCNKCGAEIKPVKKGTQTLTGAMVAQQTGGMCLKCYKEMQK